MTHAYETDSFRQLVADTDELSRVMVRRMDGLRVPYRRGFQPVQDALKKCWTEGWQAIPADRLSVARTGFISVGSVIATYLEQNRQPIPPALKQMYELTTGTGLAHEAVDEIATQLDNEASHDELFAHLVEIYELLDARLIQLPVDDFVTHDHRPIRNNLRDLPGLENIFVVFDKQVPKMELPPAPNLVREMRIDEDTNNWLDSLPFRLRAFHLITEEGRTRGTLTYTQPYFGSRLPMKGELVATDADCDVLLEFVATHGHLLEPETTSNDRLGELRAQRLGETYRDTVHRVNRALNYGALRQSNLLPAPDQPAENDTPADVSAEHSRRPPHQAYRIPTHWVDRELTPEQRDAFVGSDVVEGRRYFIRRRRRAGNVAATGKPAPDSPTPPPPPEDKQIYDGTPTGGSHKLDAKLYGHGDIFWRDYNEVGRVIDTGSVGRISAFVGTGRTVSSTRTSETERPTPGITRDKSLE